MARLLSTVYFCTLARYGLLVWFLFFGSLALHGLLLLQGSLSQYGFLLLNGFPSELFGAHVIHVSQVLNHIGLAGW